MRSLFLFAFILLVCARSSAQHQLVKLWETDTTLKVPESVLYDEKNGVLYVSNIDGAHDGRDGKGSIGKIGLDGKIIAVDWVKGLNAPKGMALYKNMLWVSDLDEVVGINITTGTIEHHIKIEGAVFLNDVAMDDGIIYVSDSRTKKVHKIDNGVPSVLLSDLKGPNGLLADDDELYVLDAGSLLKMNKDGSLTKISEGMEPGTDGIENVRGKEFVVSCWEGTIYYVSRNGSKQKLLDTRAEKSNTADIGYDREKRIVYVPTFYKNKVVAYQLQ